MVTTREVAEWMLEQIDEEGQLLQVDAVARIEQQFGAEFVYLHPVGQMSISRAVLAQFRRLTGEGVVWVTRREGGFWPEAHWRRRQGCDPPGRTSHEY